MSEKEKGVNKKLKEDVGYLLFLIIMNLLILIGVFIATNNIYVFLLLLIVVLLLNILGELMEIRRKIEEMNNERKEW